jgi:hypothetical protein
MGSLQLGKRDVLKARQIVHTLACGCSRLMNLHYHGRHRAADQFVGVAGG